MALLLDTHAFLWYISDDAKLSPEDLTLVSADTLLDGYPVRRLW